ncbi:phage Gp37/Gp68 family protein [Sphingomonas sp. S-NIH.Pt1_0416]|uniref:phage Gp37/Gp68 family protein n=2 Tax=Sphingomonas TaxID=13687 RepID=UPI0032163296
MRLRSPMAENSAIEWTDHTFNPWEGCQKAGPGCELCYAEKRNARFGGGIAPNWGPGAPRRRTSPSNWRKPLRWDADAAAFYAQHGRRQRVFCASLADVFDNAVDPAWRTDLFDLIKATPNLDWLLLTKRIGNVEKMTAGTGFPENVWLGATVVNQVEAERDIPKLATINAEVRFLSIEPLLRPIELGEHLIYRPCPNSLGGLQMDPSTGMYECCSRCDWTGIGDELAIHWVIVGGESGVGARPMHPDWARGIRDRCAAAGIPFLFKQWGEHSLDYDRERDDPDWRLCGDQERAHPGQWLNLAGGTGFHGERVHYAARVGKKAAGRLLDGVQHDGVPA